MKVALVTSWEERCGIAGYAQNLIDSMNSDIEFIVIPRPFEPAQILRDSTDCKVVHINYEPGLMPSVSTELVQALKASGRKTLLTLHTSHGGDNRTSFTTSFDKVVVHEKTTDGFSFIPMGIPWGGTTRMGSWLYREARPKKIGTAGFPFPWKGFTQVVQSAKLLGIKALVICPESRHADAQLMKSHLLHEYENTEVITEWLSEKDVIKELGTCWATVFAYHGGNYGISGACRLGLATGLPIVLTKSCRQFRDLYDYEDEVYFADTPDPKTLVNELDKAMSSIAKRPQKLLADMSWQRCSALYSMIYKELGE